jgi:hypothetical protein
VLRSIVGLLVCALTALVAVGCGGSSGPSQESLCKTQLEPYLKTLKNLDSRLSVGITYADYGERVGDIAVAHDNVEWDDSWEGDCLSARSDADTALAAYKRGGQRWTTCIRVPGCSASKAPKIQLQWSAAKAKVTAATQLLDQIESES